MSVSTTAAVTSRRWAIVGLLFTASLFTPWGVVIGGVPSTIALILWFWPKKADTEVQTDAQVVQEPAT